MICVGGDTLGRNKMQEERELLDRMITWLKYHDIKSLMELVMQAIDSAQT